MSFAIEMSSILVTLLSLPAINWSAAPDNLPFPHTACLGLPTAVHTSIFWPDKKERVAIISISSDSTANSFHLGLSGLPFED